MVPMRFSATAGFYLGRRRGRACAGASGCGTAAVVNAGIPAGRARKSVLAKHGYNALTFFPVHASRFWSVFVGATHRTFMEHTLADAREQLARLESLFISSLPDIERICGCVARRH